VSVLGWVKGFGRFWWDFLIGDDWTIAATVVAALAAAYGLHRSGVAAWWIVPAAGIGVVTISLVRR
jgi:hypothetical protein